VIEIAFPVIAIVINIFVETGSNKGQLPEDIKIAIIGIGLLAPIITFRLSINKHLQKNDDTIEDLKAQVASPLLGRVFASKNNRMQRFVSRRLAEVNSTIETAVNTLSSGDLNVSEYYNELNYLADLIVDDKRKQGKKFSGEIWAMTSFAEGEWEDQGYEEQWGSRLIELVNLGISTYRLCIVPDEVMKQISLDAFADPIPNSKLSSFVSHLKAYYSCDEKKQSVIHYAIQHKDCPEALAAQRGFFALKLSDGALHILTGETVKAGALTACVLFSDEQIMEIRQLFERYTKDNFRLENVVSEKAKDEGFKKYLTDNGIDISITNAEQKTAGTKRRSVGS
jgi:hypothetical protein